MLSPTFVPWDVGYPLYTYGSICIIALIIWQMKKSRQKLRLEPNRSCYRCHRRIKQRSRERTSRARRTSQKEAEKLQELLSVMKSQGWLPQVEGVRRLLCTDPCCQICNDVALEIQQLLEGENNQNSPTLLGQTQGSSHLDTLSMSGESFEPSLELGSQSSRAVSPAFITPIPTQLMDQKPLTQSADQSTGAVNVQDCWTDYLQQGQKFQVSDVSEVMGLLPPSSLKEPGISPNQQETRKKKSQFVLENQEASEVGLGNKMKIFLHWINPEMKGQRPEESILLPKAETLAKAKTKNVEKSLSLPKDPVGGANSEKTTEDPEAQLPPPDEEGLTFCDAPQY
ncbi:protein FAM205C [Carlito syrichta]|uniref:Protein FAM205C n=1 Tax=Carlito syrichta TaxID=1868482 RepID=A0A3Q0DUS7_CARSF|nr:protein FAM205C [Carlito syrichta]